MHWMDGWSMGWMGLGLLLVLVSILWLVWTATRRSDSGAGPARNPSAEEILKERYARGEIDRNDYEQRLGDLRK